MHTLRLAAFLSIIFLTACGAVPSSDSSESTTSERSGPIAIDRRPVYAEYEDRITGHGRASILFFYKHHDPFSQKSDATLLTAYASGAAKYSTYRIDLDASTGAALRFGVFVPNTFVLLDQKGDRVGSLVHPTTTELLTFIQSAAFPPKP